MPIMNKKLSLIFYSVVLATSNLRNVCISPHIHDYLQEYQDESACYEKNFPCCVKRPELLQETCNPVNQNSTEDEIKDEFYKIAKLEIGEIISKCDVDCIFHFKFIEKGLEFEPPSNEVIYAIDILNIMDTLSKLMFKLIKSNCEEKKLKTICFTFLEKVDGVEKSFEGTVIKLL